MTNAAEIEALRREVLLLTQRLTATLKTMNALKEEVRNKYQELENREMRLAMREDWLDEQLANGSR
jgi:hypothetical protein